MKVVARTVVSYYDENDRLDERHIDELTVCKDDDFCAAKFYDYLRELFVKEFGEFQAREWFGNEDIDIE